MDISLQIFFNFSKKVARTPPPFPLTSINLDGDKSEDR